MIAEFGVRAFVVARAALGRLGLGLQSLGLGCLSLRTRLWGV